MKKIIFSVFAFVMAVGFASTGVSAQDKMMKSDNPMVGGAPMYKTKNIVDRSQILHKFRRTQVLKK